uniref:G_PROTEIN_RECEP_F1_2 domain-containing protein n=1 Tax=Syphacia muris TaxID=451379 RepID=A0A0N5AG14_9BILA
MSDLGTGEVECLFGSVPTPDYSWLLPALEAFHTNYSLIHPYVVVFICCTGIIMNIITMIVLLKAPVKCPVTVLLFAVAGCDLFVMLTYFIFVIHFLFFAANRCDPDDYSFGWAIFMMFHAHTSVIFHATSIWITVLIAQIRILTLSHKKHRRRMIKSVYVVVPSQDNCFKLEVQLSLHFHFFVCRFRLLLFGVVNIFLLIPIVQSSNAIFIVCALQLSFWANGLCFKMFPCILLTISIILLVKILTDVSRQRSALAKVMNRKKIPRDCISPILLVVLTIFLITELPQGILLLLTGIFASRKFHYDVYLPLGDFMDLLSLVNSAVNFIIYCTMSRNFRRVLIQMLRYRRISIRSFSEEFAIICRLSSITVLLSNTL